MTERGEGSHLSVVEKWTIESLTRTPHGVATRADGVQIGLVGGRVVELKPGDERYREDVAKEYKERKERMATTP